MTRTPHYSKAPITEAIIEIRWQLKAGTTLADFERIHEAEKGTYPAVRKRLQALGLMELGPRVTASASQEQTAFLYISADEKQIYQARLDGFAFSRLAPYESWQPFQAEARRLWNIHREALKPVAITRLAVRYINRLDLPGERVEMKDYFRLSPEVPPELPQSMSGFLLRVQLPQEDLKAQLVVNQTIIPPVKPQSVAVILDLDLFRDNDVPNDDNDIWAFFESLHERKNEVFENCITNPTRELIR